MGTLPGPSELLELKDGESATFTPVRFEEGEAVIHPDHAPQGKKVPHLRVHVAPSDKAHFPYYWDVHATTLVAQLTPWVKRADAARLVFTVTAHGFGEKKRFSVETRPS